MGGSALQQIQKIIDDRSDLPDEATAWAETTLAAELRALKVEEGKVRATIDSQWASCEKDAMDAMDSVKPGGTWANEAVTTLSSMIDGSRTDFVQHVRQTVQNVVDKLDDERSSMNNEMKSTEADLFGKMIESNADARGQLGNLQGMYAAVGEATQNSADALGDEVDQLVENFDNLRRDAATVKSDTVDGLQLYIREQLAAKGKGDSRLAVWAGGCGSSEKQGNVYKKYCLTREAYWSSMPSWIASVNGPEGKFIAKLPGIYREHGKFYTHGRESLFKVDVNGVTRYTGQEKRGNGDSCAAIGWGNHALDFSYAMNEGDYFETYVNRGDCGSFTWAAYNPNDGKSQVQFFYLGAK